MNKGGVKVGLLSKKPKSKAERELQQAKKDLLDTQEMAADLFEQNTELQNQFLDLAEILAMQAEGGEA